MPRTSLVLTLTFIVSVGVVAQAAPPPRDIIPAGTILQCTVDEPNFSSKTALVGDPVLCHLGAISSFGHPAFPRGAMLGGHLEDFKDPGRFFGKGWIQLEFDRLVLPGAEILPLSAKIISAPHMRVDAQGDIHGKGHPKRDAALWAIPVFWPIKIMTLPARGPYPALKGETRLSLRLMEDVEVPYSVARNSVPMPPWASPSRYQSSSYQGYWPDGPRAASAQGSEPLVKPATYTASTTPAPQVPVTPETAEPTTIIAMKGGTAYLAREYWVDGGQMSCIFTDGTQKQLPLEKIDLYETSRLNRERNVDFVLQTRDMVQ